MTHHVILGAGPAGVIAAETIRKHAPNDRITLVGNEEVLRLLAREHKFRPGGRVDILHAPGIVLPDDTPETPKPPTELWLAGQAQPNPELITALQQAGFAAYGLFAPTLKSARAVEFITAALRADPHQAVINATDFMEKSEGGQLLFI